MTEKKKQRWRQITILIVALALCISTAAQAQEVEEGGADGVGVLEGSVKKDIYQVVMPTVREGVFDFILDPQGLINATDGAAYKDKKFEKDSTLFFKRTDGRTEEDYSNKSDYMTITNKSTIPVDVSVEVQVVESSIKGITLSEDRKFTDDTENSLYLAITDGENEVPVSREGASIHTTVEAAPEDAYELIYENDEYVYKMKDNLEGIVFPEYSFQLTGAVNEKGDWKELGDIEPKIVITWKVTKGK